MKWHFRFMEVAKLVSSWSKDPEKQVGCVIVDKNHRIISTGYNGYSKGMNDSDSVNRLSKVVHAEVNAILNAKQDLRNCIMYIYPLVPCSQCAGIIAQAGIIMIVVSEIKLSPKWNTNIALEIFQQARVNIEVLNG